MDCIVRHLRTAPDPQETEPFYDAESDDGKRHIDSGDEEEARVQKAHIALSHEVERTKSPRAELTYVSEGPSAASGAGPSEGPQSEGEGLSEAEKVVFKEPPVLVSVSPPASRGKPPGREDDVGEIADHPHQRED